MDTYILTVFSHLVEMHMLTTTLYSCSHQTSSILKSKGVLSILYTNALDVAGIVTLTERAEHIHMHESPALSNAYLNQF